MPNQAIHENIGGPSHAARRGREPSDAIVEFVDAVDPLDRDEKYLMLERACRVGNNATRTNVGRGQFLVDVPYEHPAGRRSAAHADSV